MLELRSVGSCETFSCFVHSSKLRKTTAVFSLVVCSFNPSSTIKQAKAGVCVHVCVHSSFVCAFFQVGL